MASEPAEAESPAPTRRERKRTRTRTELVAATRGLIVEKGVAGLRIDQITERADVALGSFYNHFGSKDEIVEAVVEEAIEGLVEAITARSTRLPDAEEAAIVPLRRFVRLAYDDPDFAGLLVNLERADAIFEHAVLPFAVRELERGIREGVFEIPDVGIAVTAVIGTSIEISARKRFRFRRPAGSDEHQLQPPYVFRRLLSVSWTSSSGAPAAYSSRRRTQNCPRSPSSRPFGVISRML